MDLDPAVRTSALTKAYGSRPALAALDLELLAGEVLGFLGPNGAGKTTLLRLLSGALQPTSGTAAALGLDPWADRVRLHARLGFLPGDLRLPPDRTGTEVLDLYQALRGGQAPWRAELVERFCVPLSVPAHQLSKGNRQKLGIVQALMSRPPLLLLDEPTSGLDPLAQEVFDDVVREASAAGTAVLLSSHVLGEVERVADRVAMLRQGRLVTVQSLADLRAIAPHHVRVRIADGVTCPDLARIGGVRDVEVRGDLLSFTAPRGDLDSVVKLLATVDLVDVSIEQADLESLFLSYYEGGDDAA